MQFLYLITLFLIPLGLVSIAAYGKLQPGPYFGMGLAGGAMSSLLTYLLTDFNHATIQFIALSLGALCYFLSIGILGDRFSYRSPMVLYSAIALFPWGLVFAGYPYLSPALWIYVSLAFCSILFAILLLIVRRNVFRDHRVAGKARPQFILAIPVLSGVTISFLISLTMLHPSLIT